MSDRNKPSKGQEMSLFLFSLFMITIMIYGINLSFSLAQAILRKSFPEEIALEHNGDHK